MPLFSHSPSEIVQQLLVDLGLATLPSTNGAWPVYNGRAVDQPDEIVVAVTTAGVTQGRDQTSGETEGHAGVSLTIRSTNYANARAKANAIDKAVDEDVLRATVTIGSSNYLVQALTKQQPTPNDIGTEPETRRNLFTINLLAAIQIL